jgi:rhamnulose-1-phosphate aldolase
MGMLDIPVVRNFIRICTDGWLQGWHERNGGNLSCRLTEYEIAQCRPYFRADNDWSPLGVQAARLGTGYFIVTGSGKYMRNVSLAPHENICITELNEAGDSYRIVWGLEGGGRPTSEFPTHIMNHSVRAEITQGASRVIYHAHTPAIIALTYILPLTAKAFSRALWQSATECPVVFPQGLGVVEWMVPGGVEIARATSALMKQYEAVVWAHHGLFCSGPDLDSAFGLMHTIEKAADIYLRILNTGKEIRQTITGDGLRAIAREFKVSLNEAFLD